MNVKQNQISFSERELHVAERPVEAVRVAATAAPCMLAAASREPPSALVPGHTMATAPSHGARSQRLQRASVLIKKQNHKNIS